jgi:hypothetical protein
MKHKASLTPRISGRSSLRRVLLGGITILPSALGAILPIAAAQAQTVTGAYSGPFPLDVTTPGSDVTVTSTGSISGGSTGVSNQAIGTTLTNSGTISGNGYGIYNDATMATLTNSVGGIISGSYGISNGSGATISALNNSGLLSGGSNGIINYESNIGTLTNNAGGTVSGGYTGIANDASSVIDTLSNSGTISGGSYGIENSYSTMTTLNNSGTVDGVAASGVYNVGGTISALTNSAGGAIEGGSSGIDNVNRSITTLSNSGLISGDNYSIDNDGAIATLTNDTGGSISGGEIGVDNDYGTIGALTNSGTISGHTIAIVNLGTSITSLANSGMISGNYFSGIYNVFGTIGTLTNNAGGTVSGGEYGIDDFYDSTISTLNNSGAISGGDYGIGNVYASTINTLNNSGTILGTTQDGIYNDEGTIGTLTNGTGGVILGGENAIDNVSGSTINSLNNSGILTGVTADGINNTGMITTLTNNAGGVISGGETAIDNVSGSPINSLSNSGTLTGVTAEGINNTGAITTLTNNAGGVISGGETAIGNVSGSTINSLSNSGTLTGVTADGINNAGTIGALSNESGGTIAGGDDGIYNGGSIGPLNNSGGISGRSAISNAGSITSLTNSGTLSGSNNAIYSAGGGLGTITNTGVIAGNVDITGQSVTILGASGNAFGTVTGGTFTVDPGDSINFDGGNEYVDDAVIGNVNVTQGMLGYRGALTGNLTLASGGTLLASGTVNGNVIVDGTYEVDIAGTTQANAATPLGASGYYSYLYTSGVFAIGAGATLDLVSSAPADVLGLGTKLTIVTAEGGISGQFSNVLGVSDVAGFTGVGTRLVVVDPPGSLYIAVVPAGASSPFASYALTANARSTANVVDQILAGYPTDPAISPLTSLTPAQITLIDAATTVPAAQVPQFLSALDGQIHGAMVAVAPQAGQQMEGAVYDHLGDVTRDPAARHGVWGDVSTQFGSRGSDGVADGFHDEVTQVVVGADLLSNGAARLGIGFAHASNSVSQDTQSGTAQDNAGFVYGQLPLGGFEIQGIGSYGATSTNSQRPDPLGGTLIKADDVGGNDALVSFGVSRPFLVQQLRMAPYARVTWQQISEAAFTEDTGSAAALSVNSFAGNGVRSMIGVTTGSTVTDPLVAAATYKFDFGVGEDAGSLVNPSLHANLAGLPMSISTPHVSSTFVQASASGTLRVAQSAYVYGQLSGAVRGNATLAAIAGGLRINF